MNEQDFLRPFWPCQKTKSVSFLHHLSWPFWESPRKANFPLFQQLPRSTILLSDLAAYREFHYKGDSRRITRFLWPNLGQKSNPMLATKCCKILVVVCGSIVWWQCWSLLVTLGHSDQVIKGTLWLESEKESPLTPLLLVLASRHRSSQTFWFLHL